MGIEDKYYKKHYQNILKRNKIARSIMQQASNDLAQKIAQHPIKQTSKFRLEQHKQLKKEIDNVLKGLNRDLKSNILHAHAESWVLSNDKHNEVISEYVKGLPINNVVATNFTGSNLGQMYGLADRYEKGMRLSDRVWKLTNGFKDQIEHGLGQGIVEGESAEQARKNVQRYLNNPDARFRRVNKNGKLVPSKPMQSYHPGRGVYRSARKNALRLTRTETNTAYAINDYYRRQSMAFVTGIQVELSDAHPRYDMCDPLAGRYPKGFKFMTWHPHCLCYATSITLDKNDFMKYLKTGQIPTSRFQQNIPRSAWNWIQANQRRLKNGNSQWVKENLTGKKLAPKKNVVPHGLLDIPVKDRTKQSFWDQKLSDVESEAQSVKEVQDWIKREQIADEVDLGEMPLAQAQKIHRFLKKYRSRKGRKLKHIRVVPESDRSDYDSVGLDVEGFYDPDGKYLNLNKNLINKSEDIYEDLKKDKEVLSLNYEQKKKMDDLIERGLMSKNDKNYKSLLETIKDQEERVKNFKPWGYSRDIAETFIHEWGHKLHYDVVPDDPHEIVAYAKKLGSKNAYDQNFAKSAQKFVNGLEKYAKEGLVNLSNNRKYQVYKKALEDKEVYLGWLKEAAKKNAPTEYASYTAQEKFAESFLGFMQGKKVDKNIQSIINDVLNKTVKPEN